MVGQDARPTAYPSRPRPLSRGGPRPDVVESACRAVRTAAVSWSSNPAAQLNNAGQKYGTTQVGVSPPQAFGGMMTYLDTNPQPVSGDHVGPVTSRVSATPNPATVTAPVTVAADFTDVANGGSNVDAAEVVVDDLGVAEGTGTPFTGAFGTPAVAGAIATLSTSDLTKLSQGRHTLWVRAHDSAGNWGVVNSVTVNLAVTGAVTTGPTVTPNPVGGLVDLSLAATGDDTALGGTVTAAEYFVDAAGANGDGQPMTLAAAGAAITAESTTIPAAVVGALAEGRHSVLVHTQDSFGLWGPMATVDLVLDRTAPTLLSGAVLPAVTNGSNGSPSDPTDLRVNAAFTDTVSGAVNSGVAAAEGFIDTAGTNGSGFTFLALDGSFNQPTENTYGLVPLGELTRLADGTHQMLVHARDTAGNWGPLTAVTFTVDRTGPTVSASATSSAGAVNLTATATDALTGITAGEWYEGTDPGVGAARPLTVTGTGATTATLTATISGLTNGTHTFWVRAKDAAGNWGKASSATVTVTTSTLIFADNFNNGAGAWSQRVGPVRVAPASAFGSSRP